MPLTLESGVALRDAFARLALPLSNEDRTRLRAHVRAFVLQVKEEREWPPEHVLIAVKRFAVDADPEPKHYASVHPASERERLLSEVIGWAIEAYYGLDSLPRPAP